jgi:hypothetical protein
MNCDFIFTINSTAISSHLKVIDPVALVNDERSLKLVLNFSVPANRPRRVVHALTFGFSVYVAGEIAV